MTMTEFRGESAILVQNVIKQIDLMMFSDHLRMHIVVRIHTPTKQNKTQIKNGNEVCNIDKAHYLLNKC